MPAGIRRVPHSVVASSPLGAFHVPLRPGQVGDLDVTVPVVEQFSQGVLMVGVGDPSPSHARDVAAPIGSGSTASSTAATAVVAG